MPFRSARQRSFMHAKHPEIAAKWDAETGGKIVPADSGNKTKAPPPKKRGSFGDALGKKR